VSERERERERETARTLFRHITSIVHTRTLLHLPRVVEHRRQHRSRAVLAVAVLIILAAEAITASGGGLVASAKILESF
jgi:hypothetical protein